MNDPSQLMQIFQDSIPTALGAVLMLSAVIVLMAIIDGMDALPSHNRKKLTAQGKQKRAAP